VVPLLIAHAEINVNKVMICTGTTPLWIACLCGFERVVSLLLAHAEKDVNKVNETTLFENPAVSRILFK
jgi:hypothetical protein